MRAQARRIAELELALADAEARLLSQARVICGAADAAGGDLFGRRPVREIIEDVLGAYPGITWEEIIGVGRERRLVEPRHRCMAAVYEERKDLSLEKAVHKLTQDVARVWRIPARGVLKPGFAADVVIFDLDTIDRGGEERADDLPAPGYRLVRRASGVDKVFVNGSLAYSAAAGYTDQTNGHLIFS